MDIITRATEVANALADVVNERKLFSTISGKRFVRVEGWTTLGAMLGIMPREVSVMRHDNGGYEAVVELVRVNDGQVVGRGSALCGMDEKRWSTADEYARRSMAITRATGKAYRLGLSWIMTLAGYEATPAEEIPDDDSGNPRRETRRQPARQNRGNGGNQAKWAEYYAARWAEAQELELEVSPLPDGATLDQIRTAAEVLAARVKKAKKERPYGAGALRYLLRTKIGNDSRGDKPISDAQKGLLAGKLAECFAPAEDADDRRHAVQEWLVGKPSVSELTMAEAGALIDWILLAEDQGGGKEAGYPLHPEAYKEAAAVYREAMKDKGQAEMDIPA